MSECELTVNGRSKIFTSALHWLYLKLQTDECLRNGSSVEPNHFSAFLCNIEVLETKHSNELRTDMFQFFRGVKSHI